ncbi:MAG: hypothetical protein ACTFAL_12075 [Candidatus Electronema sp. V4]|uniref:hypothetical protein n=1 Tax=Candidatus Electronema sp. V4 TaxID=3454756 RepID=UPI0040558F40
MSEFIKVVFKSDIKEKTSVELSLEKDFTKKCIENGFFTISNESGFGKIYREIPGPTITPTVEGIAIFHIYNNKINYLSTLVNPLSPHRACLKENSIKFHVSVAIDTSNVELGKKEYEFIIKSGYVSFTSEKSFKEINPCETFPFAKHLFIDTDAGKEIKNIWKGDGDICGFFFGINNLRLELIDGKKRKIISFIENKEKKDNLWMLSGCKQDGISTIEDENNKYKEYFKKINAITTIPRFDIARDLIQGVFYYIANDKTYTIMQPNFALKFGGGAGGAWSPRWLLAIDTKLIFTDTKLLSIDSENNISIENNNISNAENEISFKNKIIFKKNGTENNKNYIVDPIKTELKCVGASGNAIQSEYLWQYGMVTPNAPSLPEAMAGWTRFHIPDAAGVEPLPSGKNVLRMFPDPKNWLLELGRDITNPDAAHLQLQLTIKKDENEELRLGVLSGCLALYSPEIYTLLPTRILPDPSAPPNIKRLTESLGETRLIFAPVSSDGNQDEKMPSIKIEKDADKFLMTCTNKAVVTYAPYVSAAGIDFVSAGTPNLVQYIDKETSRPVVERDTTHTLTPFEIIDCKLTASNPVGLENVKYKDEKINIASVMALAPWVEMRDQAAYGGEKKRRLFHRNLVLEHGELAAASADRSVDGTPNALVKSPEEFIRSVRDDYALAADFQGDGTKETKLINWLPGVAFESGKFPSVSINYTGDVPSIPSVKTTIVNYDGTTTNQELTVQSGEPEDGKTNIKEQDWLTCDLRLNNVFEDKEKQTVRPTVRVSLSPKENFKEKNHGSSRARNGSVPLLFDGKDFVSCSTDPSKPLSWFTAELENGDISIIDPLTRKQMAFFQPQDKKKAKAIGTGRTDRTADDKGWIVRVTASGELQQAWLKKENSVWKTDDFTHIDIGSTGINQEHEVKISSFKETSCIFAADSEKVRLIFLNINDQSINSDVDIEYEDVKLKNPKNWSLLFVNLSTVLLSGTQEEDDKKTAFVLLGKKIDEKWSVIKVDNSLFKLTVPASKVTLAAHVGENADTAIVLVLGEDKKSIGIGEVQVVDNQVFLIDSIQLPDTDTASDICALMRPAGRAGLPVGSHPFWICVATTSGSIDVWLSTTKSADKKDKQPYFRLEGHFGKINGMVPCCIDGEGDASDVRSGLVTFGSDGTAKLWDIDADRLVCSHRNSHWMLDNLGVLRKMRSSVKKEAAESVGNVAISYLSRPEILPEENAKEEEGVQYNSSITISTSGKKRSILVDDFNNISFFCEGLRLKKKSGDSDDTWEPEIVGRTSGNMLASRGYFGVFGFFSDKESEDIKSYLPKIGGIPVFIHEIVDITISENDKKITAMTLNGVLINPLLFDGLKNSSADYTKGYIPSPIVQAISEDSIVQFKIGFEEDIFIVKSIGRINGKEIKWNTMISEQIDEENTDTQNGFDGILEYIKFFPMYNDESKTIILNVSEASIRCIGGSHEVKFEKRPLKLSVYDKEDNKKKDIYGFKSESDIKKLDEFGKILISDIKFEIKITDQLSIKGTFSGKKVSFSISKNGNENIIKNYLHRQGLYSFLFRQDNSNITVDDNSGADILTLWREERGKLTGNLTEVKSVSVKIKNIAPVSLSSSVGRKGKNQKEDVRLIFSLFNKISDTQLTEIDTCSEELISKIIEFQKNFLSFPDGLINADGTTWKKLYAATEAKDQKNNFNYIEMSSTLLEKNRREAVISGMLEIPAGKIFFIDQEVKFEDNNGTHETKLKLAGFIDIEYNGSQFSGPVYCTFTFNKEYKVDNIEINKGLYRCVSIKKSSSGQDKNDSDVMFHEHGLNLTATDLNHCTNEYFVMLDFDSTTNMINLIEVPRELVPIDKYFDMDSFVQIGVAKPEIIRLAHLQELGTKLRFSINNSDNLFSNIEIPEKGKLFKGSNDKYLYLLQPVVKNTAGIKIQNAGIYLSKRIGPNCDFVSENVISISRISSEEYKPLINCVFSVTNESSLEKPLSSYNEKSSSLNRCILFHCFLFKNETPKLYFFDNQKESSTESFYLSEEDQSNSSIEKIDFRLLTHTEAKQWQYSLSDQYVLQPDTPSEERDLYSTAWREIVVGRDEEEKPVNNRSILLQETTAFHDMPRQWISSWNNQEDAAEQDSTFYPSSMRIRFAPDKPGAIIHHRLQTVSGSKGEIFTVGPSVDFTLREPMQLNPPKGASMKLTSAEFTEFNKLKQSNSREISFAWEEILGEIPITAQGTEIKIRQLPSQAANGAASLGEVKLEVAPESQSCIQIIVQINDQLVNIDDKQPLFPVYNSNNNGNIVTLPNIFVVSSIKDIFSDRTISINLENNTKDSIALTPCLSLSWRHSGHKEFFAEVAERHFKRDDTPPLFLFSLSEKANQDINNCIEESLNGNDSIEERNNAIEEIRKIINIRFTWKWKVSVPETEEVVEAIYGGSAGVRKLRPVPYDTTAAKFCAVLSSSDANNKSIQRNILFGDAGNVSQGEGDIEKDKFVYKIKSNEKIETSLPDDSWENKNPRLTLVKYFVDGQTLRAAVTVSNSNSMDDN